MSTAQEHIRKAQDLLSAQDSSRLRTKRFARAWREQAQVHATLAVALLLAEYRHSDDPNGEHR